MSGSKTFRFTIEEMTFDVIQDEDGVVTGYHQGKPSISSSRMDTCAVGLIRKHLIGLPEGLVIKLSDYTDRPDVESRLTS